MSTWASIKYMGFWDVPLIFLVPYQGELVLFDCEFDEEVEDYRDFYKVYAVPPAVAEDLPKDWTTLHTRATRYLGNVPVQSVRFDPTRRREVDTSVLEELMGKVQTDATAPAQLS